MPERGPAPRPGLPRRAGVLPATIGAISLATASLRLPVRVYHAGSLDTSVSNLAADFTATTGFALEHVRGPSGELADRIRAGAIEPDVFLSADPELNNTLMGEANGNRVAWYVLIARQRMVLVYSPASRFGASLAGIGPDAAGLDQVLTAPGFRLVRDDPTNDPAGYRALFVLQLAEGYFQHPGLARAVLGEPTNPEQVLVIRDGRYLDDPLPRLRGGALDAYLTYRTGAVASGLPMLDLPDELNLSDPARAADYARASYTNPQGQTVRATPLVWSATIPSPVPNPDGAAAFVRYLLSDAGRRVLIGRGYDTAPVLVGGEPSAVPHALQDLIEGPYAEP
jgi:molybdate/tungstate transport system substrate-binding protein